METIETSIEVNAPVSAVYNQWTQFEEFPLFMQGVQEVQQHGDKRLHWKAEIAGRIKEWEAEIFEQIPDQRVAWRSISGAKNSGMVNFERVDANTTRVSLHMAFEPETATEKIAGAIGVVTARVRGDLKRFKDFIETRGRESGGWRGVIEGKEVLSSGDTVRTNSAGERLSEPRSKRLQSDTRKL